MRDIIFFWQNIVQESNFLSDLALCLKRGFAVVPSPLAHMILSSTNNNTAHLLLVLLLCVGPRAIVLMGAQVIVVKDP